MITSFLGVICLFVRQYYKTKWFRIFKKKNKKFKAGLKKENEQEAAIRNKMYGNFDTYRSHCSKFFIFEILILIVVPIPHWDYFIKIHYHITSSTP